jgi:hypothetical protein
MPASSSVDESRRPHGRTRAYAGGGTRWRVAIVVLIAVSLVWLAVGTIYLSSAVGLELQDAHVIDPGG